MNTLFDHLNAIADALGRIDPHMRELRAYETEETSASVRRVQELLNIVSLETEAARDLIGVPYDTTEPDDLDRAAKGELLTDSDQ